MFSLIGPEHFYANCNSQYGTYTFKVRYQSGINATLLVTAGDIHFTKSVNLVNSTNHVFDEDYPLCTVVYGRDEVTGLDKYTIHS